MGVLETIGLGRAISGTDYLQGGTSLTGTGASVLSGYAIGMIILFFLTLIGIYFYLAFAFMAIGRKANLANPGVAWLSPIVTIFEASKVHW